MYVNIIRKYTMHTYIIFNEHGSCQLRVLVWISGFPLVDPSFESVMAP